MSRDARLWSLAAAGAAVIAAGGFAAAQFWGQGAGMPLVALGSTLWTAGFVRWAARSGGGNR